MKHIEINLGKACNNRCRFCMSGALAYFVDFAKAKEDVIASAKNGYQSLGFLGGEVTLYPQLLELISVAKESGFRQIHIISNGRRYADKNFLSQLITAGVNRFSVSIHSHLADVEDYLTQVPCGFEEKIQGLKNLMEFKKQEEIKNNISLNFVINNKNYQDILRSLIYFAKMGFTDFRLNFMWPEGNASNYYQELLLSYQEFYPYIAKIIDLSRKLKLHVVFEGIPLCVFPNLKNYSEFIGEVLDSKTDVVIYEKSGKQNFNWQERKINELKSKGPDCLKCSLSQKCEGVWNKYIEIYGWNEFKSK